MVKPLALLLAIFILSFPAPVLAAEPTGGKIDGQIVNGTADGSSVAEQEIFLITYLDGVEENKETTKSSAGGQFVFDDLSSGPGYNYEVMLTYQQVEYYSEKLNFDEGETVKSVEITVYDATTSDESIRIDAAHTIISFGEDALKVMDYFMFVNDTDRAYIGLKEVNPEGDRETLRFSLPAEVFGLGLGFGLMECCVVDSAEGFSDTMAVLPGVKEVTYTYGINYDSGAYVFSRKINYPTSSYEFLVQGENTRVASDLLIVEDPLNIEGARYNYLTSGELLPGDTLIVQLSDLPESTNQGAIIWMLAAVILLGLGFSFAYLVKKRKFQPVSREDSPEEVRQRFLIQLAQLDDDFESGEIAEEDYRKLRAEGKIHLVELMQRAKDEKGGR